MKYLVFVGMIFSLSGAGFYIRAMLQGKAKPNKVSWIMWSIVPLIAAFAALSDGVRINRDSCFYVWNWVTIGFYNIII